MLVAILQLIEDKDDPYQIVARLVEAVPPGSYVVISRPPSDMERMAPGLAQALARLNQTMAQRVTPRSREQVTRFFDGLDLIEPGVVPIQQWRPASDLEAAARAGMWGGAGQKP
jgi:hypothetical protein